MKVRRRKVSSTNKTDYMTTSKSREKVKLPRYLIVVGGLIGATVHHFCFQKPGQVEVDANGFSQWIYLFPLRTLLSVCWLPYSC